MTDHDAETAVPHRGKRFTKRAWIGLAAGIGAIVVGGSLSAPGIVADAAREQAGEKLAAAEQAAAAALEDFAEASQAETDARVDAANTYFDVRALLKSVKGHDEVKTKLVAELATLADVAELEVEDDQVAVSERETLPVPEIPETITIEAVPTVTKTYEAATKVFSDATDAAESVVSDVEAQLDAVEKLRAQLPEAE